MNFNKASMLCAHKMKTDACQGDSGIVEMAAEVYVLNIRSLKVDRSSSRLIRIDTKS